MFLCMALCLTPIALPAMAFAVTVVMSLFAPVYPVEATDVAIVPTVAPAPEPTIAATRSAPPAPCRVSVARMERRAYPLPAIRAAYRSGVLCSVKVRYSGAPSHPSLDVSAY